MSNWISVKDRLPADFKTVLVTINFDNQVHIAYITDGKWYAWVDDEIILVGDAYLRNDIEQGDYGVIAWQELPEIAEWIATKYY